VPLLLPASSTPLAAKVEGEMEKTDIAVPQAREAEASTTLTPALEPQPPLAWELRATTRGAAAPGAKYTRTPD
jgi:hypothetical protein